jgi:hypothetical protein
MYNKGCSLLLRHLVCVSKYLNKISALQIMKEVIQKYNTGEDS